MSHPSPPRLVTAIDVLLLRTVLRRLGGDGARAVALAVATWATIACAAGGVVIGVGLRVGVAAGVPEQVARSGVVAAVSIVCATSVVRLACGSGLAARLAGPDGLRSALGVPRRTGARLGVVVHAWLLLAATGPLALAWLAADADPMVALACGAIVVAALAAAVVLARHASTSGAGRARASAVLGSSQRIEVVALAVGLAVAAAGLMPGAHALRAALAQVASEASGHGVASGAVAAGLATIVASDRLLDRDVVPRIRRVVALVDAGAAPAAATLALARGPMLPWAALAGVAVAAALAWGAPVADAIALGGIVATVGVGAELLAVRLAAPASRVLAAAALVACASLITGWWAAGSALAMTAALVVAIRWRLRCPPS
ncbi:MULTISPECIES: hypothetical protein [unclassified Agrococcus]|uniref:hypothetical protein n=1 Tax=unclassified Agrococcus TaxID=2615065 RepID=UPI003606841B